MHDNQKLKSTQQGSNYVDYRSHKVGIVAQRFLRNFCNVNISLKCKNEKFYFSTSKKIKELLNLDSDEYAFCQVISQSINDLLLFGRIYIEQILYFNESEELCAIKFIPVTSRKTIKIFGKLYYSIKKYDNSKEFGFIDGKNLVTLRLKDVGYRNGYFRHIFKKMDKYENLYIKLTRSKKWLRESKLLASRENYKKIKINKKTFWTDTPQNEYISEPYLVYRSMQFDLIQKKFLDYVLNEINLALEKTGKTYDFTGKIEYISRTEKYSEYMEKFSSGQMNCEDLCKVIF